MGFFGTSYEVWTDADVKRAAKEGWQIASSLTEGEGLIICENSKSRVIVSDTDKEADKWVNFVVARALKGSRFHMRACWLAGQPDKDEYEIPTPIAHGCRRQPDQD